MEKIDLIKQAERVDESLMGYIGAIRVAMGLLKGRITPENRPWPDFPLPTAGLVRARGDLG